jgi:hypothetical protein
MQFELSVCFDGRSYTAIRNLPAILRLREDLVTEMESHKSDRFKANLIPEVPRLDEEGVAGLREGVVGRGFAFLHALIRSYVPAVEGWLRQVLQLRPPKDSPSLMHFLWEPVSSSSRRDEQLLNTAMLHLDSIEESEHDFDE